MAYVLAAPTTIIIILVLDYIRALYLTRVIKILLKMYIFIAFLLSVRGCAIRVIRE